MGFNLNQWLDDLGISGDQRKPFEEMFGKEEVKKKLESQFLMHSDYTKKTTELAGKQKELEAQIQQRMEALDSDYKGIVEWKSKADGIVKQRDAELQRLTQELQSTKEAMSKISTEYGIDPSQYVQGQPTVPVKTFDESILGNYVKADDFQKAVSDAMQFPQVAAELMDLNSEHYELFGKRLPSNRKLVEAAISGKKSIRDVWANEYKVEDRRAEMAKKAHDEELERVRQETEARVRSELKLPAQRPNAARPIVLSESLKGREIHSGPASDNETVNAALAAYSSGKYAEGSGQ